MSVHQLAQGLARGTQGGTCGGRQQGHQHGEGGGGKAGQQDVAGGAAGWGGESEGEGSNRVWAWVWGGVEVRRPTKVRVADTEPSKGQCGGVKWYSSVSCWLWRMVPCQCRCTEPAQSQRSTGLQKP